MSWFGDTEECRPTKHEGWTPGTVDDVRLRIQQSLDDREGSAVCWGENGREQASPPEGERLETISRGGDHTCALRPDGRPVCWGNDAQPKASPPDGLGLVSISSGQFETCGIRADGTFVCRGRPLDKVPSSPAGEKFTSIVLGENHTCALRKDGTAFCWGSNVLSTSDIYTGQATPHYGDRFMAITAGNIFTVDSDWMVLRNVGEGDFQERRKLRCLSGCRRRLL